MQPLMLLLLLFSSSRSLALAPQFGNQPKKIAVVGAGIGGSAVAYYLRQEFGPGVQIDVFESGAIGGRLGTVRMGDHEYEVGGAVIHPLNLHMKHFVDTLGVPAREGTSSKMAIFDGQQLIFEESDWFLVNVLRLLWRYGLDLLHLLLWVDSILDKFMRIYQYQQLGYSFTSVDRMLHTMGGEHFLRLQNQTLLDAMVSEGFSQSFINDLVQPVTRGSYGQGVRIHGFVGAVALAGAGPGLWAVDGGNKRICSGLLYNSKSVVIKERVTSVSLKLRPNKSGAVSSFYEVSSVGEGGASHSLYDIVIIATPLHSGTSDISFSGFSPSVPSHFPGRFHQTVSTLVHGRLNVSFLGCSASDFRVSEVLTTDSLRSLRSLSSLDPVHVPPGYRRPPGEEQQVWRLFSSEPLTPLQLQSMFLSWESVSETRWLAYPSYSAPQRRPPPFILHERMYYLNPLEWAASAMEMSAISARNVALLAHHRWHQQSEKVDQEDLHTRLQGEL